MVIGRLKASAASRCGPSRARNEDVAVLGTGWVRDGDGAAEWHRAGAPRAFVAGVLDGLGGHQGGDLASARAAQRLVDTVGRWSSGCTAAELAAGLEGALADAHRELTLLGTGDPNLAGCGTTCTAIIASAEALVLLHIGDSRCYRRRDGLWKQLTLDHSVLVHDLGGAAVPRLVSALGANLPGLPSGLVEDLTAKCFPGDVYVLVTDGVQAAVGEAAMEAALEAPDASTLLELALARGGPDNATAVRLELFP